MIINLLRKKWKNLGAYTRWAIYIILIGAIIKLLIASLIYITGDACWYYNIIRFIAKNNGLPAFEILGREPLWHPPMFFIISSLFYKFFGFFGRDLAEFSVKLVSPIASTLMVVYTFLLTKKLFNTKLAFYAILFLSFIPDFIYESTLPYFDVLVALFVLMSIYYILSEKIVISSFFMAFALLTKYNALFAIPIPAAILYLKYNKQTKLFLKNTSIYLLISCSIGSIAYIRNWVLLGNPIYPYFGGDPVGLNLLNLVNPFAYFRLYLSFFGVPDGYYQNLFFLDIPFLNLFLFLWMGATILFILPFLIGLFNSKIKNKKFLPLVVWVLPYLLFIVLTFIRAPYTGKILSMELPTSILSRYIIVIFPVLAIIWAKGFERILSFRKMYLRNFIILFFILIVCGFVVTEFAKAHIVKQSWNVYGKDFQFVRENIPENSKILVPFGSCYEYNFERETAIFHRDKTITNISDIQSKGITYIWVNQHNTLYGFDPDSPAVYPKEFMGDLGELSAIYYNPSTKTKIIQIEPNQ